MADIKKIKANADLLITYIDKCTSYSSTVPMEVYDAFSIPVPSDDGTQSLASILFWSAYELLGETEIPGAGIISWILGGLVDYYSQDGKVPPDLNQKFINIIDRYTNTMLQLRRDLGNIYEEPEAHLNDTYTIPFGTKKTIKVSELADYDIPQSEDPHFTDLIDAFRKCFRRSVTKEIMPQYYQIATVFVKTIERPDPFEPERYLCSESPEDDNSSCSNSKSNCPLTWDIENSYILVTAPGSNNNGYNNNSTDMIYFNNVGTDQSVDSFYETLNAMVKTYGSGCYYSSKVIDNTVQYYCYWLVNYRGCDDITAPNRNGGWQVAPEAFTKWLFIDDGGRETLSLDAVAYREDVFKNWNLDGYKGVI